MRYVNTSKANIKILLFLEVPWPSEVVVACIMTQETNIPTRKETPREIKP